MYLIDANSINTTTHKKARAIMFDNSSDLPVMRVYENTVIPGLFDMPTGEYTVNYSPDIVIPLLDTVTGQPTGEELPINNLIAIMYSVYAFGRNYQPPPIEQPGQPEGEVSANPQA